MHDVTFIDISKCLISTWQIVALIFSARLTKLQKKVIHHADSTISDLVIFFYSYSLIMT